MKVENFVKILGADFFTGVPDSQLKPLCDYLMQVYGIDKRHHVIAANEGNCAALAAGYHLATGKIPVVYMQNSGEGNIINPAASLLNEKVYAIPMIFVIGLRGEPGIHDEPQHIYQGEVTIRLLEDMDICHFIVSEDTSETELKSAMDRFNAILSKGKQAAFVIRRNALSHDTKTKYKNNNKMSREEVIRHIVKITGEDPIISTTGKLSRELYDTRISYAQSHKHDFLTVGSMGHASSIALGIAINKPNQRIWCIDGDGAVLMHMGSMAVIGANKPNNMIHIIINNGAHESVGGMPTVAEHMDFTAIAKACGYPNAVCVDDFEALDKELKAAKNKNELSLVEVKCSIDSRNDLGRPKTPPLENKKNFMEYLSGSEVF